MDALSSALANMVRRQAETDRRLEEIEKALGIARAPVPPPPPRVETPAPIPEAPSAPSPLPLDDPGFETKLLFASSEPRLPPFLPLDDPGFETKLGLAWV